MRVLFVSSEVHPLAKTGGLADVSQALPAALSAAGVDVRILMPGYREAKANLKATGTPVPVGRISGHDPVHVIPGRTADNGLPVWLIDCPTLFDRPGRLYTDDDGREWPDNPVRFGVLSQVAAKIGLGEAPLAWRPNVVHANDWHAGLVPALLHASERRERPATVFTVHNMAFQGNFPTAHVDDLELPRSLYHEDGLEYYGQVSFLKAGLRYSDVLTTVSPSYADEILTPEFGMGLESVLQQRRSALTGILNGVDYDVWEPKHDSFLPVRYDAQTIAGKQQCKESLQRELGLTPSADTPLLAFMSRLTGQKMADVVLDVAPNLIERYGQFVLLAEGDPALERSFRELGDRFPGRAAIRIGYHEPLAHRVLAGADILLAPARFEPCGLTQIYALRYGTIPVVRSTGGLADTITDAATSPGTARTSNGFVFAHATADELESVARRAVQLYHQPLAWRRLQLNAMAADFSWTRSAASYIGLYRKSLGTELDASTFVGRSHSGPAAA